MTPYSLHGARGPRRLAGLAVLVAAFALPMGCDLTVIDPDIVTPDNLSGAAALPTIRSAALGDFSLAYAGSGADGSSGTEGQVTSSAMLADEFINSETFPTRIEVDRRSMQVTNGTITGWFRTLSRARRAADFAADQYRTLAPDTTLEIGFPEMLALAGFAHLFFAENWCSGVPISTANADGSLEFGPPLSRQEMTDSAVSKFTQALNAATALGGTVSAANRTARINLATIGLARAQLYRANTGGEITAVATAGLAAVPTTFVYNLGHSENSVRQNNGVYVANVVGERYSVATGEGTNGLVTRTAGGAALDGRVPQIRTPATDVGFDGATPQIDQLRYLDRKTSIPLATGAEARLIEAEAALASADTVTHLARHNALRAAPPIYFGQGGVTAIAALPALTTIGLTSAQVVDQHFRERGFWLWLTGHRLADLRRLARQTAWGPRAPESVFPTGAYFKGGVYGTDYNFPVPFDETNNPNFTACTNRNP